jgi:hypothetical protein
LAQKPACCHTFSPWILFMTIQNHALDVSRSIRILGWLASNWLGVLSAGGLDYFWKVGHPQGQISTALGSKPSLLLQIQPMDPLCDHPKSCIGCIKIH